MPTIVQGMTVFEARRPKFLGLVLATYEGADRKLSAQVLWESGVHTTIKAWQLTISPTQFPLNPALRAEIRRLARWKRRAARAADKQADWLIEVSRDPNRPSRDKE